MMALRRAAERRCERRHGRDVWRTFFPEYGNGPLARGFGALEGLDEDRRRPGPSAVRHRHRDAEVVTYVREGAMAHDDTTGCSGVVSAGEMMRRTTDRSVRHRESNASHTHDLQLFHLWIRCAETGLPPDVEQKRFSAGDRRSALCVVASPDGRNGSIRIHQDVAIYSALLHAGQHVIHELLPERRAWLQVLAGSVRVGDVVLAPGDGAGIIDDRAVSLTAQEAGEILLVDLGADGSSITMTG